MTKPLPQILLLDVTGIIQRYEQHPLAAIVLPEMPIQVLISMALCSSYDSDTELIAPLFERIFKPDHPVFYHLNEFDLLMELIITDIDALIDKYAVALGYRTDIPLVLHKWVNTFTIALSYYEQRNDHQAMFERSVRGMLRFDPARGMEQFPYRALHGA